jgi:hypothetical protein
LPTSADRAKHIESSRNHTHANPFAPIRVIRG